MDLSNIYPPEGNPEPPPSWDGCEVCNGLEDVQYSMGLMLCVNCRVDMLEGRLFND